MFHDLRFGMRMLLKEPGFSLIAVFTLALGIGATSAVFSLIQGVLLTHPPYRQPEKLVLIPSIRADGRQMGRAQGWPAAQWMEWSQKAKSLETIAAYGWTFNFLILPEGSVSLEGMVVTRDYFRVMELQPKLGRTFSESETTNTAAPVIVLGYNLWRRQFNGDSNIIGKQIRISRRETPVEVIGVMPEGVRFLPSPWGAQEPNYNVNAEVDFWIPTVPDPKRLKSPSWDVVARLKSGFTLAQSQAELNVVAASQAQADRDFQGTIPRIDLLIGEMNRDGRRILLPLLGAAGLVLLMACGNVAALLLVRGLQRQQEYAIRSALGAGRVTLFRQVSVESLLLALLGGSLGVALAFAIVSVFKLIGRHAVPRLDSVTTGWPVLAWGLGSAVFAALIAGLLPALRASRLDPMRVIKSAGPKSSAGRGDRRLLRSVTMVQTALTLALLVGAGLLIRTMSNLAKVQSGYSTQHILTMNVTSVEGDWTDFHRRALERVSSLSGVQYAAFAWGVPLTGNNWPAQVIVEGQPVASRVSDQLSLPLRSVTEDYFKLFDLSISEGRGIRSSDAKNTPGIAVVNRTFADRYFPNAGAIGKKIWLQGPQRQSTEIVGVVTNARSDDLTKASEPEIYLSLWQASAFSKHLVVRTAADPRALLLSIQHALHAVNPTVAVENAKTMEQILDESLASRAFAMQLLVGFSMVGSLLTLIGVYGVLSLSVASRRREIAIRAAVGAGQRDIRNLIFGEGFRLIAGGVISGLAASLLLSRVLQTFLFGVEPNDPATLISVGVLFAGVAMVACWIPTRRAARVNSLEALRYE